MFKFLLNIFTNKCMEPTCDKKATQYPHGVPCCDKHTHEPECLCWLGDDCDCGKE